MATFAPSPANTIAVARPIPLPAPVMKATLPASLGINPSFPTANSKKSPEAGVWRSAGCRGIRACRIAKGSSPGRHITSDHAACADQRIITDGHARQDDGACSDPGVAPNADRAAKLQPGGAPRRVAWMVGRQDLHPRPDLRAVADGDLHNIEDHAVEVQEHASTEANVETVVAMKWRPDHRAVSDFGEAFHQQLAPLGGGHVECGVVAREPPLRRRRLCPDFGRAGVVELSGKHLLLLGAHPASSARSPAWFRPLEKLPIELHPLTQLRVRLGFALPTLRNPLPQLGGERRVRGQLVPTPCDGNRVRARRRAGAMR